MAIVCINEPPRVLPTDALGGRFGVHVTHHLGCVIKLHSVGIVRTHRDHGEIWEYLKSIRVDHRIFRIFFRNGKGVNQISLTWLGCCISCQPHKDVIQSQNPLS